MRASCVLYFAARPRPQVKLAAGESEAAWKDAGKAAGLQIWRIEEFKVKPWPKERYGEFFTGDSYIVLHTVGESPKFVYDVHFWIGQDSTQDEYATAAYKTVELDDHLGGAPIQHREVQGSESSAFLSYFKTVKFLSGGANSGFKQVKPEEYKVRARCQPASVSPASRAPFPLLRHGVAPRPRQRWGCVAPRAVTNRQPRLLHVKGTKNVIVREVPLAIASVNSGDVFILDAGLKIFQLNGAQSGGMERVKGTVVLPCDAV